MGGYSIRDKFFGHNFGEIGLFLRKVGVLPLAPSLWAVHVQGVIVRAMQRPGSIHLDPGTGPEISTVRACRDVCRDVCGEACGLRTCQYEESLRIHWVPLKKRLSRLLYGRPSKGFLRARSGRASRSAKLRKSVRISVMLECSSPPFSQ